MVILWLGYALYSLINATRAANRIIQYQILDTTTQMQMQTKEYAEKEVQVTQKHADKKFEVENTNLTSKYILMYTEYYYNWDKWQFGAITLGEERLKSFNCPSTNCVFTINA